MDLVLGLGTYCPAADVGNFQEEVDMSPEDEQKLGGMRTFQKEEMAR